MEINIRTYRAIEHPEICRQFAEGHKRVLEIYDIKMITSNNETWMNDPGVYVVVAEHSETGKLLGGARIQIKEDNSLPIENAVGKIDPNIYNVVNGLGSNRVAELCGLWNTREVAGYGLGSIYLGWTGVALTGLLGVKSLIALCAPATVRNCLKVGFTIERSLGKDGFFNYPKLNLVATAMYVKDVKNLLDADPHTRETIEKLIAHPNQTMPLVTAKGNLFVNFDLRNF